MSAAPIRVYTGLDARDADALRVFKASLLEHASVPVDVVVLKDWELRQAGHFWRSHIVDEQGQPHDLKDGKTFSTSFSFTRFLVPALEMYADRLAIWADPDMMWRADVAELIAEAEALMADGAAVACVQHEHTPPENLKMAGCQQSRYLRKNWSSLMVLRPSLCRELTPYQVNNANGAWLHAMFWAADIAALDERWNWLEGWSDPALDPALVHYTRGTPDLLDDWSMPWADEYGDWFEKVAA